MSLRSRGSEQEDPGSHQPSYRFFAGKGGVGKTTLAAAYSLARAEGGESVLAISIDPAHSLGHAFGKRLGARPRALELAGTGALSAVEVAAPAAYRAWVVERRGALRQIAEQGTLLAPEDADRLLALPPPGVDELMGLLEVLRLGRQSHCRLVVVDTAPTSHTLRLLEMPDALRRLARVVEAMQQRPRLLAESFGGEPPGPGEEVLADLEARAAEAEALLRDPLRTSVAWVTLPEELPVLETARAVGSLQELGIPVSELLVNRIAPEQPDCLVCNLRRQTEEQAIAKLEELLPELPIRRLPALDSEPRGRRGLRQLHRAWSETEVSGASRAAPRSRGTSDPQTDLGPSPASPAASHSHVRPKPDSQLPARRAKTPPGGDEPSWLPLLAPARLRLLFFGGKGGVGKSTCAAAVAALVTRHRPTTRVELLSTDPAHSLGDVLDAALTDAPRRVPGAPVNLAAREIDAGARFRRLQERHGEAVQELFAATLGSSALDAPLERELMTSLMAATPPGLDELVAVASLTDRLSEPGGPDLLVIDAAPTGHALRLLELPALALRWDHALLEILLRNRQALPLGRLAEELVELSRSLKGLIRTLRDPASTRFVVVTRAAELPRRETLRLLTRLDRLGIEAAAVVINAMARRAPDCRRCRGAAEAEALQVRKLGNGLRRGRARPRYAILQAPERLPPPRGPEPLEEWARAWEPAPEPP